MAPFKGVDEKVRQRREGNPEIESAFVVNEDGSISQAYIGYTTKPPTPICEDCNDERGVVHDQFSLLHSALHSVHCTVLCTAQCSALCTYSECSRSRLPDGRIC